VVLPTLAAYQRVVLESGGLWPDLMRCVLCGRPAPAGRAGYFSARQGGLVCRSCGPSVVEKRLTSAIVLDALRCHEPIPAHEAGAFELLDYIIACTLGRRVALAGDVLRLARRI
jgi:recombinational DNA repair protein (RecF pathway)